MHQVGRRVMLVTSAASGAGAAPDPQLDGPAIRHLLRTRHNRAGLDGLAAAARAAGGGVRLALGGLGDPVTARALADGAVLGFTARTGAGRSRSGAARGQRGW